jgi:hypothetical protein
MAKKRSGKAAAGPAEGPPPLPADSRKAGPAELPPPLPADSRKAGPAEGPPPLPAGSRKAAPVERRPPLPAPPRKAAPAAARAASAGSAPTSMPMRYGLSVWWVVVPTVIYAIVTADLNGTLLLAGAGVVLRLAQGRPQLPANVRAFLPLLQSLAVFTLLGGNPIVVAAVAAAAVAAFVQRDRLIRALDPWWRAQAKFSPAARRLVAFGLTLAIGYFFGASASGSEWTYTFISIVIGTVVTFLLVFNPSEAARSAAGGAA